jgi:hypothetical protein
MYNKSNSSRNDDKVKLVKIKTEEKLTAVFSH